MHPAPWPLSLAATFAVAALAAFPSHAAPTGTYLGLSVADSRARFERSDFGPLNAEARVSENRHDHPWSVIGGYRVDGTWSVEGGYVDAGRYRSTLVATAGPRFLNTAYAFDYRARSLFLAGKANFAVTPRVDAFVRLGIAGNRVRMNASVDSSRHIEPPLLPCPANQPQCHPPFSNSALFASDGPRNQTRGALVMAAGLECALADGVTLRLGLEDWGRFGNVSDTGRFRLRGASLAYIQSF
jgi:opacity protein-like surface antigen